jgi:hypothetical protein
MSTDITLINIYNWILEVIQDEKTIRLLDYYNIIGIINLYGQKNNYNNYNKNPSIINNEFKTSKDFYTSSSYYLLEKSKTIRLYNINNKSIILKNISITRLRITISSGDYINIILLDLIVKIFFIMYKSNKFIFKEESLFDIYIYHFSKADLSSNYYIPKAIYTAYIKEVNKIMKKAFKNYLLLLELLYSYYTQGLFKLISPKLYRYSSFKTYRD